MKKRLIELESQALEQSILVEQLENMFNCSLDMIGTGNLSGYFTKINSSFEQILGYTDEEFLMVPFIDFVHCDDIHKTKKALAKAATGDHEIFIENRYRCKDDSYKWIEWKVISKVQECQFVAVGRDITDRKQAEDTLLKAHHELEQRVEERTLELKKAHELLLHAEKLSAIGGLSASISHEFNNPLHGIMSVLYGIKHSTYYNEENAQLVDMAVTECNHMKDLIKSLQDFNRPSSGKVALMYIHATIDSLVLLNKNECKINGLTITTTYASDMPPIMAVANQIKQVLLNLLNNAIYFCERGDTITINTEVLKDNIAIQIQDTGRGIKPEHMNQIFDPFFTTKPDLKGTGLGLSISYGIIKKHGGRIDVKSEPNKGTIFKITLPVVGVKNEKNDNELDAH